MKGISIRHLCLCNALLFFLLSSTSYAKGDGNIAPLILKAGKGKKISLVIEEATSVHSIEFREEQGKAKIQKIIDNSTSPYLQIFNLETWPAGIYEVIIRSKNQKIIQPFQITKKDLTVLTDHRKEFFAPIIAHRESKSVKVFMDNHALDDIEVCITDKEGDIVFKRTYRGAMRFKRNFDLRQLKKNLYLVKVATAKRAFYKHIRL